MPEKHTQHWSRRSAILSALAAPSLLHAAGGFYVPAEEARHQATFMQWPVSREVYADAEFLRMTQDTIAKIANTIAAFEPVIMLADQAHHAQMSRVFDARIEVWDIPTEDLWARDAGPLFAVNAAGDQQIMNLNFNGWGNKQVHHHDGQIAGRVARRLNLPLMDSGLVGEAGGVDQDGHGLLMAHESSWIIKNRNRGSKAQIEARLKAAFGVDRVIWAKGIKGQDITDYHIDSLARFTGPNRALIQLPDHRSDQWARAMWKTHDALVAAGVLVEIIPEPVRPRVTSADFVASYANYYVCNGAVICGQFGDAQADAQAQSALRRHYPDREIVPLNVDTLGALGGGIHCATQQWPAT